MPLERLARALSCRRGESRRAQIQYAALIHRKQVCGAVGGEAGGNKRSDKNDW